MTARPGRILLVDDNNQWLEELLESLQRAGYYVETATTSAEAWEKMTKSLFHIVILDIRMEENNQANRDGIELLQKLKRSQSGKETKVVMLSAYNNLTDMRTAFREQVLDVLSKNEFDNNVFVQQIADVFNNAVNINLDLQILWQHGSSSEAVQRLKIDNERITKNTIPAVANELEDLLCRLFSDARNILIRPLTAGYSGMGVLSVRPIYKDGGAQAVVVKFGDIQKTDAEYTKFQKYAEPYIGGGRNTRPRTIRHTSSLGGIVYSLLGTTNDPLKSFAEFYYQASIEQIKVTIQELFTKTCGAWYDNPGIQQVLDLHQSYARSLDFDWKELNRSLTESLRSVQGKEKLTFNALNSSRKFINPISATEGKPAFFTTYTCITHGDFNQNNILVDSSGHGWLIDFQETEPGHIFRDAITLDTEIRCQLLRANDATLIERLEMEEKLCSATHFSQLKQFSSQFQTQNTALNKTFELIIFLRTLAYSLVPHNQDDSMSEYYHSLLYSALNTSRFRTLSIAQREHALLSASLLAENLGLKG